MRRGIERERSGILKSALTAGVLLCFLAVAAAVCPALLGGSLTVSGEEAFAQTEAFDVGGETGSVQTEAFGFAGETETESGGIMSEAGDILGLVLPDEMMGELEAMPAEEIAEYIELIQAVLLNPEFQSLFEYEEVRDLAVTLVGNALRFASREPETTNKILETMGVDRRVIILFFALLKGMEENKEVPEKVVEFLTSKEGAALVDMMLTNIDQETIEKAVESLDDITAKDEVFTAETE